MFWFKACPKCYGDLYSDRDVYGSYVACLQCSHNLTGAEEARLKLSPSTQVVRSGIFVWDDKVAA